MSALARWFGIELNREPNPYDCLHRLAFALAEAHVPGCRMGHHLGSKLPGGGAPPVLTVGQTTIFGHLVQEALVAGVTKNGDIATLAREKFAFTVPRRGSGPRKRGNPGKRSLPRQTAADHVRQMRAAWEDVVIRRKATATSFQFLVVSLALLPDQILATDWGVVFGLK